MTALTRCLIEESIAIRDAADKLDFIQVEKALDLLTFSYKEKSKLIVTGVGKSGIVGRKIAATFSSIGLTSVYLNPLDALHGDLGIVNKNDVCILLSNSGNTPELIELLNHIANRNISTITILGNRNSVLASQCDVILEASVNKEVCPLNLAPTASTAVAMAIGDSLAAVWMERNNISPLDFAFNHPAGSLGKKLTLKVKNIMIPISNIHLLNLNNTLIEIIKVITTDGSGIGLVKNEGDNKGLIGIITDGDLRRNLERKDQSQWNKMKAKDLMTIDPVTIGPEEFAIEALKLMENNKKKSISVLPVVDVEKNLIGLLRLHDLIKAGI